MIFYGKSLEELTARRTRFAFFPVRIGTRPDGAPIMAHFERYEERYTGEGHTGASYMQRRLPGSNEVYDFMSDGVGEDPL
jgi:hypothetical protein